MTDEAQIRAAAWQRSWDQQQEAYLPDREHRFAAMLDAVDAVTAGQPVAILDLAGGTGSISHRVLRRFPSATTTLVDIDPVLLSIATASLDGRTSIVSANLRDPDWSKALPAGGFDAVLTATALHWIPEDRLRELYRDVRDLLRPGGVFINADHMVDDGLPTLSERFGERERVHREALYAAGAALSWDAWWDRVAQDSVLGPLVARREAVFAGRHAAEFSPPASWHLDALRDAGFAEVGLVWRGSRDAAVAALR